MGRPEGVETVKSGETRVRRRSRAKTREWVGVGYIHTASYQTPIHPPSFPPSSSVQNPLITTRTALETPDTPDAQ